MATSRTHRCWRRRGGAEEFPFFCSTRRTPTRPYWTRRWPLRARSLGTNKTQEDATCMIDARAGAGAAREASKCVTAPTAARRKCAPCTSCSSGRQRQRRNRLRQTAASRAESRPLLCPRSSIPPVADVWCNTAIMSSFDDANLSQRAANREKSKLPRSAFFGDASDTTFPILSDFCFFGFIFSFVENDVIV